MGEEVVRETFASMLGYYVPKSPELHTNCSLIVESMKKWTTEVLGLIRPPHVSDGFPAKMGIDDHRAGRFGRSPKSPRPFSSWGKPQYGKRSSDDTSLGANDVGNSREFKSTNLGSRRGRGREIPRMRVCSLGMWEE